MRHTQKLTFAAIFVALAFVFTYASVTINGSMQFGITEFPLMGSGFVLGPIFGTLVGLVKDIITMMKSGYPPSLFTLSPILLGLIPGIFYKVFGKEKLYSSTLLIACAVFTATIARTLNNSAALHYVYGMEWKAVAALLPLKFFMIAVEGVLYVIIFRTLLPTIDRVFNKED